MLPSKILEALGVKIYNKFIGKVIAALPLGISSLNWKSLLLRAVVDWQAPPGSLSHPAQPSIMDSHNKAVGIFFIVPNKRTQQRSLSSGVSQLLSRRHSRVQGGLSAKIGQLAILWIQSPRRRSQVLLPQHFGMFIFSVRSVGHKWGTLIINLGCP